MTLLDIGQVKRALTSATVGARLLYYPSVSSTMDVARKEAAKSSPEGTVVLAEEQTIGRGRFQRTWVSPPGSNLYFSILLYPTLHALRHLTMATSLAVARGITHACGLPVTIKWPNDIRSNGKKLCGILPESALEDGGVRYAIVGIGLNVNFDPSPYPEIAATATSLMLETGRSVPREEVLVSILREMDETYRALEAGQDLREPWRSLLETLGKRVQVLWGQQREEGLAEEGLAEEGLAEDVDDEGNLVLLRDDGSRVTLAAGEVTLQI